MIDILSLTLPLWLGEMEIMGKKGAMFKVMFWAFLLSTESIFFRFVQHGLVIFSIFFGLYSFFLHIICQVTVVSERAMEEESIFLSFLYFSVFYFINNMLTIILNCCCCTFELKNMQKIVSLFYSIT